MSSSSAAMGRSRRSFKNILVYPSFQLRMGILFLSVSALFHAVLTVLITALYYSTMNSGNGDQIWVWMGLAALCYVLFLISSVLVGVWYSHRLVGPIVPIRRYIRGMIAGDYSGAIKLRSNDELQDLAEDLNTLAQTLREKK